MSTVIDISCDIHSTSLWARKIWTELFQFYNQQGGNLKKLDSFLCDLKLLENWLDNIPHRCSITTIYWYVDFDSGYTDIRNYDPICHGSRSKIEFVIDGNCASKIIVTHGIDEQNDDIIIHNHKFQ